MSLKLETFHLDLLSDSATPILNISPVSYLHSMGLLVLHLVVVYWPHYLQDPMNYSYVMQCNHTYGLTSKSVSNMPIASNWYRAVKLSVACLLLHCDPWTQGWKYVKLVGSNLDLRKVSWKKRVDVIPSRLSTDTEMSSDEAPRHSHSHTPLPGEDLPIRPTDRQRGSRLACLLLIRHFAANCSQGWAFRLCIFLPLDPQPVPIPILLASTAAHLVDDSGQAFLCACPSVFCLSQQEGGNVREASLCSLEGSNTECHSLWDCQKRKKNVVVSKQAICTVKRSKKNISPNTILLSMLGVHIEAWTNSCGHLFLWWLFIHADNAGGNLIETHTAL